MSTVNKLLVPVDGSAASKKAADKAVEIAKKYNSEITFLTVASIPDIHSHGPYYGVGFDYESMTKKNVEINKNMLESIIGQLELEGIKYEKVVVAGEPYDEILKAANKSEYDYIVMGRRGFSKIARFFIGSVTQRVISESPCPVIVVKE